MRDVSRELGRRELLLAIPATTYLISYVYLAFYHGEVWLWNTVVHEGGTLTLFWSILYASHFLGHVPSLTVIALMFSGWHGILSHTKDTRARNSLLWMLLIFLGAAVAGSITHFGESETLEFVLQNRQSVERLEDGGSWLLHLPSTVLLLFLIPVYIVAVKTALGSMIQVGRRGWAMVGAGVLLTIFVTLLACVDAWKAAVHALSDPRYLAHAVRELATFLLTYFPIPLYFWARSEAARAPETTARADRPLRVLIAACGLVFILGAAYYAAISLSHGIGDLAQSPSFAHGGRLSIGYLLASHYFEHVLDSIYFTLLCLWLNSLSSKNYRIFGTSMF